MKTFLMTILLLGFSASLIAGSPETGNFVRVNGETHYGTAVKMGHKNTKLVLPTGEVKKFCRDQVQAYKCKDCIYEKLPVVLYDNEKPETAFMKLITERDGNKLYLYTKYMEDFDPFFGVFKKAHARHVFFVFRDGKFVKRIDDTNWQKELAYFHVQLDS